MKKTKLALSDLGTLDPETGRPTRPIATCEGVQSEVNASLLQQCALKVNKLQGCTSCEDIDRQLPFLSDPTDAKLVNTAYDGAGGFLAAGNRDTYWEVGIGTPTAPPPSASYIPAWVYKNSAWINSPFSNANWISYYQDGQHDVDVDAYFRFRFNLDSNINPAQFSLNMDFFSDNAVHEIYVNGVAQSTFHASILPQEPISPYGFDGFKNGRQVSIQLSDGWKTCENEIIVHVKSGPSWVGFLAQNTFNCYSAEFPELKPKITVSWGDSDCDCLETDDYEVMCISVCNPYADVAFNNFTIGRITVVDALGNQVATLPDGTPSVELHPIGPYCFGNIAPCSAEKSNCIAREFVLFNRGAIAGRYKLVLEGICFEVCKAYSQQTCFELSLCKS